MKTVSLKLTETILEEIDFHLEKYKFSTRTEFIRAAIRDKLRELDNQRFEEEVRTYFRNNKEQMKEQIKTAHGDVFKELERRFGGLSG